MGAISGPAKIVVEQVVAEGVDFRIEFKCKNGNHYARQLRGRGKDRKAENGNFRHLGVAQVIASKGGFYAQRWIEYQFRHKCPYKR